MDSNGARHRSEVIREKKKQKNKLGPRIMKTNPHCCQGVQAVFNQHIHIEGHCQKKEMRPPISLQSFKKQSFELFGQVGVERRGQSMGERDNDQA